ncbi:MAG: type II toxin-antitoxin system YafQ family toxin [Oscillibacter sp.]|nr:type II toxin-antitoxin system YafQ family toxin [Oscillibacter sp.]
MLKVHPTVRFNRDLRRMQKRGAELTKFLTVMGLLSAEELLPARYQDHAMTGDYIGCRDLHIEPDWVLIYEIRGGELWLLRTGTHSDLM